MILTADHILPVSGKPIEHGAVSIKNGAIEAVGPRSEILEKFNDGDVVELGRAAVMPGFVNCHSHLEITALRGSLDAVENDFRSWLLRLNSLRAKLSEQEIKASALAGAVEALRSGVTCMGDIGRFGHAGFSALRSTGLRGVLYQETEFSPDNRTAADDLAALTAKFDLLKSEETNLVRVGLSPHSPYTVSRELFEKLAEFAAAENIKISIHAAESKAEDDLLRDAKGFFIDVYEKFGLEWNAPHLSPVSYLRSTGILDVSPLLVHCVTVGDDDIKTIKDSGSAVAHCPRSNAKFGHGFAPLGKFTDAGIEVGLGTDSVASNNVCDMIGEAQFSALAARNSGDFVTAEAALEMATLGGAKALGLDAEIGTLEPGKRADIAAVSLAGIHQQPVADVNAAVVFSSNARDVVLTMVDGKIIYRDGKCTTVDGSAAMNELAGLSVKLF
jgi:5-methylthioadenosine/S-adenosylhomocysteine deaminase